MAEVKIYYDGWQMECCGDPFKVGDEIKWDAAKFNPIEHFVFKDADYSYEAHGGEECEISGVVAEIWAIYFRYEPRDEPRGRALYPVEYKTARISRSDVYERKFEGLGFDAYLVGLKDARIKDFFVELYGKFKRGGKFTGKIASPDQKDASGETLLNLAVIEGDAAAVQILLDNGADVNLAGAEGFTPLQRACFCKNETIFRILLSAGADADTKNDAGFSARQYCEAKFEGVKNAGKLSKIIAKFKNKRE